MWIALSVIMMICILFLRLINVEKDNTKQKVDYDVSYDKFVNDFCSIMNIGYEDFFELGVHSKATKEFCKVLHRCFYFKPQHEGEIVALYGALRAYLYALLLISPDKRLLKLDLISLLSSVAGMGETYNNMLDGIYEMCIIEYEHKKINNEKINSVLVELNDAINDIVSDKKLKKVSLYESLKKISKK